MLPGRKVILRDREIDGFGEELGTSRESGHLDVRFCVNPVAGVIRSSAESALLHPLLPSQTRCFQREVLGTRYGRVLQCCEEHQPLRTYLVQFAGDANLVPMREDQFSVRSYLPAEDPMDVLANLAHETPFFFEHRASLMQELLKQQSLAHELPGLLSSKIDLLPHQVEIADRVLRDPTIRYLLADEVGLGKTIEAGIILRQLALDYPKVKILVFVPGQLVLQWEEELQRRFQLFQVKVLSHSALGEKGVWDLEPDVVVIDEAHHVVNSALVGKQIVQGATKLSQAARHLLLLSATPILHHDSELLALLALLDPENYSSENLAAFKDVTSRRGELGRAFLAIQTARIPALVKLNAKKLGELLPSDLLVQRLTDNLSLQDADIAGLRRQLHLHISETYRIHRRLLRTRRRWLAGADKHFARNIEERNELELDEAPHAALWGKLEEWRIVASARVSGNSDLTALFAAQYVTLAEAIASDPASLEVFVTRTVELTKSTEEERRLLISLIDPSLSKAISRARTDLILEVLKRRCEHGNDNAKFVVFCASESVCHEIAEAIKRRPRGHTAVIANSTMSRERAGKVIAAFASDTIRILLTDRTGEEGFNLQFTQCLVMQDLPWSPMRIEQRLGRLDRIERVGKILCFDITSGEDETLFLDEAWRRVLADGFNIFRQSVSDLQHLIESELPRLREVAFFGGPSSLLSEIPYLTERVQKERDQIEEQDVIDGMQTPSQELPLYKDLNEADKEADPFGRALTLYLKENVGLRQHWSEKDNSFAFDLPSHRTPLVPADRLQAIARMLHSQSTVHRSVAIETPGLQFLRPGHPSVDSCSDLLFWDDRGSAFAMWRAVPGIKNPQPIFRCIVRVAVDLEPVKEVLAESGWDRLRRGGLLRMVRGWFPTFLVELFLDEVGNPAPANLVSHCRKVYDNVLDKNLAKDRAAFIRDAFGAGTWRDWCTSAAMSSPVLVRRTDSFLKRHASACELASEHFLLLRTRLNARAQAGIDSPSVSSLGLRETQAIESLVENILAEPVLKLDTMGAYILSTRPFWGES